MKNKRLFLSCLIIFLISFSFFLLSPQLNSGDTIPSRYVALSFIKEGNFDLDEYYEQIKEDFPFDPDGEGTPYFLVKTTNHVVSTFGIGVPLMYIPTLFIAKQIITIHYENWWKIALIMKITTALFLSLAVVLLFLILKYYTTEKNAFLLTGAFALATNVWTISSAAPWQHGVSHLMILLSIFFLVEGKKNEKLIKFAAIPLAMSVLIRPTNLLVALMLTIYVFINHRKQLIQFMAFTLPFIIILLSYNLTYFGTLMGNGQIEASANIALIKTGDMNVWGGNPIIGLLGILFSPSRGLFIYSPFLLFLFFRKNWSFDKNKLLPYISISVLLLIIVASKWFDWWGGHTFGYRSILDVIPFLIILLGTNIDFIFTKKWAKNIFICLIIISFLIQLVGITSYDNSWNREKNIDYQEKALWDIKDTQITYYIKKDILSYSIEDENEELLPET